MIIFDSNKLLNKLIDDIDNAQSSIEVEIYIWDPDTVGKIFENALLRALKRGVEVRVIVDRIGSFELVATHLDELREEGIEVRVFRPLPGLKNLLKYYPKKFLPILGALNRRNHRKIFTIDKKICYVGSFNFLDAVLRWKETTVIVTEPKDIELISEIFEYTWAWVEDDVSRFKKFDDKKLLSDVTGSTAIRTTQTKKLRSHYRKDYLNRIKNAKEKVWLVTPYFNAPRFFLKALINAAKRGVDVRLMVPVKTDPLWFSYLSRIYFAPLIKRGIKIYEYQDGFLHSKTTIIDSTAIVGSGNLNYRSFYRDLELNMIITDANDVEALRQDFIKDMEKSHEVEKSKEMRLWERAFGSFLTVFKTSF